MKKTTYLLLLSSILSTGLFAKINSFDNVAISEFINKPYLETNQLNALSFIEKENYKNNYHLLNTIKDIYIYSDNKEIQEKSESLLNVSSEEIIKNEVKINKLFEKNKEKLTVEPNYIMFSDKKNKSTLFLKDLLEKKTEKLTLEELVPLIDVLIKNGKNKNAQEIFLGYISSNIENKKKIDKSNKEDKNILLADLYSHGAYLNYNNKDLYELYSDRVNTFSFIKDKSRFNYILYKDFNYNELYSSAVLHLEEVNKIESEYSIDKKMLDLYYKASRKSLLNNKNAEAWIFSKKGIEMFNSFKVQNKNEKNIYNAILIELKKQFKLSSMKYQEELMNKGENNHASRINSETLKLLGLTLL